MANQVREYKEILKIVWYFFKPHKLQSIFVCVSMLIAGLFETMNLAVLYPVLNYGLHQEPSGNIMKQFNKLIYLFGRENLFLSSCILLVIITLLAILFRFINYLFQYRLMAEIEMGIQKKVLDRYLNADYAFFVKSQQGKLVHTATIAPTNVGNMVLYTARAINDLITCVLMIALLAILSVKTTLLAALIGVFYFFFVKRVMTKIIYRCGLLAVEANRRKNTVLNEMINGIKSIKAFLAQGAWEEKYISAVRTSVQNQYKMLMGRFFPEAFVKATSYLVLAAIGVFFSAQIGKDVVSLIPLFGVLALIISRLSPLANLVGSDFMILAESLPNTRIIYDLFNENTRKIRDGVKRFPGLAKAITFQDAWFKYEGTDKYILKGINFEIEKNKVTAIAGLSGSGKTTLVNLLLRLYILQKGRIDIDGVDIQEFTEASWLSRVGYVSQETFIYNDTIKENIRFGLKDCNESMLLEAAKLANAHEFIQAMPDGYETIVGDAGIKLSGGQRQRIAIARAVLRSPEIIILDEATSSLDNISERKVQEAIHNVSLRATVIIVAHRLSTIQGADKILLLHDGRVAEEGRHEKLLSLNGKYHDLYTRQLAVENNAK